MAIISENLQQQLYGCYTQPPKRVSFEFFPPKDDVAEASLWESVQQLAPLNPAFVSVTYGAGGSTRERTHATIRRLMQETPLIPAAHLTCVGSSRAEVDEVARQYWDAGVRHIVALRGDMPDNAPYAPHPQGYGYAEDLVRGLRAIGDFEISVAAYPEKHPQARTLAEDITYLKRKVDAGATRAITQFFFEADAFLRFRDQAVAAGVGVPIVPGILPVHSLKQLHRFAAMCGASVPAWIDALFEGLEDDAELRQHTAAYVAASLCHRLRLEGVEEFHFYTLNRAALTRTICHLIGVRAQAV